MAKQSKTVKEAQAIVPKVEAVQEKQTWLETIKRWFKHSETIFIARAEVAVGFIVIVIGGMDWSPLFALGADTGMKWQTVVFLGAVSIAKGAFTEWARRRNAKELDQTITIPGK